MKILLIVYDNGSYIHWFPQGLAYIAAVLKREGHDVTIYSQDQYHYPEEHLTEYLNKNRFDLVGVSIIAGYYQYRKLLKISDAINKSKNRPLYVLGGHGPAPEPEFFIRKTGADVIVIGEGEITSVELVKAIANKESFAGIEGIAYRSGDEVIINKRRPLIQDLDSIPFPAYEMFSIDYYKLIKMPNATRTDFSMPVLASRGCPFKCTFCYRMDDGYRIRSNGGIIEEIKFLKKDYDITYIFFADELLMNSVERITALCEDMLRENLNVRWCCDGRLNFARPELLKLMKRTGCVFINYGIEAMDDEVLKNMRKALTTDQIIKGIETTLAAGISPGFNIIFGNIGDNKKTLEKGVEFLLKYDDGAQMRTIRPVTPYPGSELYYRAIEKGLLKDCEDFYENKHLNSDLVAVNFTDMSDEEFHKCLLDANTKLLENYYKKQLSYSLDAAKRLYLENDAGFRGFRQL